MREEVLRYMVKAKVARADVTKYHVGYDVGTYKETKV